MHRGKKSQIKLLTQYGGIEFLIECDYDPKLLNLENLPEFYHTIFNYWYDFRRLTCDKQIPIKKKNNYNFYNFEFPFTTYYGLLRAIPTEWKSALRVKAGVHDESENCETSLKIFSTKEAYSSILDKSFSAPTAEGRILHHGFTKEEIPYIYMLPIKILKEPKLIMFQVKIIHNILPTQSSLFLAYV